MTIKLLFLSFLAAATTITALPPTIPLYTTNNCIANCKCDNVIPNILEIEHCNGPLTLNSSLFDQMNPRIVTAVRISDVIIDEIKRDAFQKFPNLEAVIIENAKIGAMDPLVFNRTRKVKFTNCRFEDNPVLSSTSIEELHYGECQLDVIPNLEQLFSLIFLNLSGNSIKEIDITTFAELFDLEELNLSFNEISRIPSNIFVNNQVLNSLNLDNNPLKAFFLNTSNDLERLSLRNCFLSSFDLRSSERLTSLIELYLNNNELTDISLKDLDHMGELETIELSNNKLRNLDDDVFSFNEKLRKVALDGNKFNSLPAFRPKPQQTLEITFFSCTNCELKSIHPDAFKYMPNLYSLHLANNNLTSLKDTLNYSTSLKILDISNNSIASLDGAFDQTIKLEVLNISGNPLNVLKPEYFALTKAIAKIDASNCKLNNIWTNSSSSISLESIKKLYLSHNRLRELSINQFKLTPSIFLIDLNNNPLNFNEEVCKTIYYLEDNDVSAVKSEKTDNIGGPLKDDFDNFTEDGWETYLAKCPKPAEISDDDDIFRLENSSHKIENPIESIAVEKFMKADVGNPSPDSDDYYNEDDDAAYDEDDFDTQNKELDNDHGNKAVLETVAEEDNAALTSVNFAKISYILSITSVFVLTALAVLIMAVVVTLCILRRNDKFNMHKANLPRFKNPINIPRWGTQLGEKKHSGSVYRPLSEDLSGPQTPKVNRYEFFASPTSHGNNA